MACWDWMEALESAVEERDVTQGRPSATNLQHSCCCCTASAAYKIDQLELLRLILTPATPPFVREGYDGMACSGLLMSFLFELAKQKTSWPYQSY